MVPPKSVPELLEDTWHQIGHKVIPHGPRVYVRTWRIPERIGHIYIPPKLLSIYKGLPHSKLVRATVVAVPPTGRTYGLQVGDFIVFPQTFFARYRYMTDDTLLGYLHPMFVHGKVTLEEADLQRVIDTEEGRIVPYTEASILG
jgi:hypothetical protein